nr:MAG TPA: hypothetical protein [Caudoviricetes sp.]
MLRCDVAKYCQRCRHNGTKRISTGGTIGA